MAMHEGTLMSVECIVADSIQPDSTFAPGAALRIELLGHFQVFVDARMVPPSAWRLKKAASLVQLLALAPGHHLHREQVLDLLWPHLPPESAGNNLRVTLHAARQALVSNQTTRACSFLQYEAQHLYLSLDKPVWVDLEAFEAAADHASESSDVAAHNAALALYQGDVLPHGLFDTWIAEWREAARQRYVTLLLDLADLHEGRGELALMIHTFKRVLTADGTNEDAHLGLMRLYARTGHRYLARRQFEWLRDVLRRELGVEPTLESQRLYDDIAASRLELASDAGLLSGCG